MRNGTLPIETLANEGYKPFSHENGSSVSSNALNELRTVYSKVKDNRRRLEELDPDSSEFERLREKQLELCLYGLGL